MNLKTVQIVCQSFNRASVCEWWAEKWSGKRSGASSGTEPERNAARHSQTEARRSCGHLPMQARDERAV
jgi:hypothetical protein